MTGKQNVPAASSLQFWTLKSQSQPELSAGQTFFLLFTKAAEAAVDWMFPISH